uniref:Uncharacterized protein n=1 Tax=Arundo donax TaxID=35708 RepID=A0A0A9EFF5_ARUDO
MKSKESWLSTAADVEKLEDPQPQILYSPLTHLKYNEPHISVSADAEKHEGCNSWALPSPITQLKCEEPQILVTAGGENNEEFVEYQDLSQLFNDAATPQSALEKLRKRLVKRETAKINIQHQVQAPTSSECLPNSNGTKYATDNPVQEAKVLVTVRKTWADMVDEDEQQLGDDKPGAEMVGEDEQQIGDGKSTLGVGTTEQNKSSKHASKQEYGTPSSSQGSSTLQRPTVSGHLHSSSAGSWRYSDSKISTDKNVNWELVRTAPTWRHQKVQDNSDRVCHRPNTSHLNDQASGSKQAPWRSSASQRALFPDCKAKCEGYGHGYVPFGDNEHSQYSSHTEATYRRHNNVASTGPWRPQNRLRVFQEITNEIKQNIA